MTDSENASRQLHAALQKRKIGEAISLVKSSTIALDSVVDGKLPLLLAVDAGLDFVNLLLDAGANVNARDGKDRTSLMRASEMGSVALVDRLLQAGADPNLFEGTFENALGYAVLGSSEGHLKSLAQLIASGANVNLPFRSRHGEPSGTVLKSAAQVGNTKAIKLLLNAGADVNEMVVLGTALMSAAEEGHADAVEALLRAGADRSIRLPEDPARLPKRAGKNASELAKMNGYFRVANLLLDSPEVARPRSVAALWRRIESVLERSSRPAFESLGLPATAREIATLGMVLGEQPPIELETQLGIHNGQEDGGEEFIFRGSMGETFRLLPAEDIINKWRIWNDLVDSGEFENVRSSPDSGVRDDWYHPGWIPLTANGAGDSHCMDLAPAPGGVRGQIILMDHEDAKRPIVAASLAEWLSQIAERLEAEAGERK